MTVPLDAAVRRARRHLEEARVPGPDAVFLMATGTGTLPDHLVRAREVSLEDVPGVPRLWRSSSLHAGQLGRLGVWMLEDLSGEPGGPWGDGWEQGFPLWLAADSGASVCIHASAGCGLALEGPSALPPGSFVALRDHLHFQGRSPLAGLGESRLGPLFPDLSMLHHLGLRRAFLRQAERMGIPCREAVGACTLGPGLETPAERRMLAQLGADVAVQSLATPLLAAAHAGLAILSTVCVTDQGEGPMDVASMVEVAVEAAPQLEDLLLSLVDDLESAVGALNEPSRT